MPKRNERALYEGENVRLTHRPDKHAPSKERLRIKVRPFDRAEHECKAITCSLSAGQLQRHGPRLITTVADIDRFLAAGGQLDVFHHHLRMYDVEGRRLGSVAIDPANYPLRLICWKLQRRCRRVVSRPELTAVTARLADIGAIEAEVGREANELLREIREQIRDLHEGPFDQPLQK